MPSSLRTKCHPTVLLPHHVYTTSPNSPPDTRAASSVAIAVTVAVLPVIAEAAAAHRQVVANGVELAARLEAPGTDR